MGPNDITLGFGGGASRLLKDILSIMRMFLFSDGGEYYFVCVLEESP